MPDTSTANVLLHVGPPKTGTTSLQAALDGAQDRLREQGVVLPTGKANPKFAAVAGAGVRSGPRYGPAWEELVRSVGDQDARLSVVSSESFAYARDDDAKRIVEALGGPRVRVVITLRPLVGLLPSRWQQFVQTGETDTYPVWLGKVLSGPPSGEYRDRYWIQLWHRRFIERWSAAAGPGGLVVVPVDKRSPEQMFHRFAGLLGVPCDLLGPPACTRNDSFSAAETEFLRACHEQIGDLGPGAELAKRFLIGGVGRMHLMRTRSAAPSDIVTPRWAQERAVAMGEELAAWLPTTGIEILGDVDLLKGEVVDDDREPAPLLPAAAARAVVGSLRAAVDLHERGRVKARRKLRMQRRRTERAERRRDELAAAPSLEELHTAVLLRLLGRRLAARLRLRRAVKSSRS